MLWSGQRVTGVEVHQALNDLQTTEKDVAAKNASNAISTTAGEAFDPPATTTPLVVRSVMCHSHW